MSITHLLVTLLGAGFISGCILIGIKLRSALNDLREDQGDNPRNGHWLDNAFAEIEEERR